MKEQHNKLSRIKRWALIGILFFFTFSIVLPVAFAPRPANALFGVMDTSITVVDFPRQISETVNVAKETIEKVVKKAADVMFKNVLKNYLNALAYNWAVELATGEKGQKSYIVGDPLGMLKDAADAAAGDFLDAVASDWAGKSQCQGYSGNLQGRSGCKMDSQCMEPELVCPNSVYDKLNITDCLSSIEQKNKCLQAGCRVVECGDLNCDDAIGDIMINKIGTIEFTKNYYVTSGAAECVSSFSLCDLGDPSLKVKLTIMVTDELLYDEGWDTASTCPITSIIDKYDEYRELIKSGTTAHADPNKKYLFEFSKSLNPKATEFGAYLSILDQAKFEAAANKEATEFAQKLAGETKPVTDKISGLVKTPATFLRGVGTTLFGKSIDPYLVYTGSVIADAVSIFTSTLASKLIERYIFGIDDPKTARQASGSRGVFGGSSAGISAAKIRFADLKQTSYSVGGDIDILSKLASCPDSKDKTPDTCVINDRFRTAISQKLTVREALEEGLLEGTIPFGYEGDEPGYKGGYPYRSLVILRKYRIIPVGWELAAKYMIHFNAGDYTLNTLIQEYGNPDSPFYRLVDPNWVLKVPELICKKQGAGTKVMSSNKIRGEDTNEDGNKDRGDAASTLLQRQDDYCADEQQCIKEKEDGSCIKWGYCIEEKPLWKFDSTVCESRYSSCETLTSSGGGEVSYLMNTVNKNSCNVGNAGCQWYCQNYDHDQNNWLCPAQKPARADDEKISFNASVGQCNTSSEGCNEFMTIRDTGTNLVLNSGFESFDTTGDPALATDGIRDTGLIGPSLPDNFSYWERTENFTPGASLISGVTPNELRTLAVNDSFGGLTSAKLHFYGAESAGWWINQKIDTGRLTDNRTFTLSLYAKRADDVTDCSNNQDQLIFNLKRWPSATTADQGPFGIINVGDKWTRYLVTTTWESLPKSDWQNEDRKKIIDLVIRRRNPPTGTTCDILIDNVQVEEGDLTSYKIYEESPKTYFRKPPDYLNCRGTETDDSACNNYSLVCAASEVGCEKYTSQTTNNSITGVITTPNACQSGDPASCNQCPEEYVGCQVFRELPIEHMPLRPARDPISFLPDTGTSCPTSAVGCEEYTNLEEVSAGGEGKEYYSFVRICVESDDPDIVPYYTWEGSDEFGYQLKKYDLKQSNIVGDNGPCTNVGAENDPALAAAGIDWPVCIDDEDVDGDGTIDYPAAICDVADVGVNPDCTEFYDAIGNTYYRLRSRLIYGSDNCKSYKNSVDSTATCTDAMCTNTGLTCLGNEDCRGAIYHMIPGEGVSCAPSYAGCRSYKGNAGDNIRNLYYEDFENGTVGSWIGGVSYSNESMNLDGHSMVVANSGAMNNVGTLLEMQDDRIYTMSFWAKSAVGSPVPITATINSAPPLTFSGQAITDDLEWNRFEIGPLYVPRGFDISTSQLIISGDSAFYIDNIRMTEVYDNKYLIKDTFTDCSGWEGCDAYKNRAGSTHYLKSFSYLCREDRVGCDAFIDTKNSETAEALQFRTASYLRGDVNDDGTVNINDVTVLNNNVNPPNISFAPVPLLVGDVDENTVVNNADITFLQSYIAGNIEPANKYLYIERFVEADDRTNYYVYDSAKSCSASVKGCERLGRPIIDGDGGLIAYDNAYLVNNPDEYGTDMCLYNEAGCQEYTATDGGRYYFKDPGQSTCTFRDLPVPGWYKAGTQSSTPDCPIATGLCSGGGANEDAPCNSGDDCDSGFCSRYINVVEQPVDGWTGMCTADKAGCTEYRDPEESSVISEDESPNLLSNGRMENYITTADPAIWTDGTIDTAVADEFTNWANNTAQGVCGGGVRAGSLCSNDAGCGRCSITTTDFCTVDGDCPGIEACDIAGGTCNLLVMQPCGNRLLATSDAAEGDTAAVVQIHEECINPNGDTAMHTWERGGVDTGTLTDNRRFKLTFSAKRDPLDLACAGLPSGDDLAYISANLYRTIDDGPEPGYYVDSGGGRGWPVSDAWDEYEYTYSFGAVPLLGMDGLIHNWNATTAAEPLEYLQTYIDFVFRRSKNPLINASVYCDVIIDNVRLQEVIGGFDYMPYYYLSGTVDKSACNGLVGREEGCRLFDDTSAFDLTYSSADSKNGEPPAVCTGTGDCDSNTIIKVRPDRECAKWLECESSLQLEKEGSGENIGDDVDDDKDVETLCLSRYICDEMDDRSLRCTHSAEIENVDQTFSSPAFVENIRFLSGMVLTGLDWDRRCNDDPNITCDNDNQCGTGGCDDPQVVEGQLLYPSMREVGSVALSQDLIKNGDFGDSDYELNQKLSCPLSRDTAGTYPGECDGFDDRLLDGAYEIPLTKLSTNWMPRDWVDGVNEISWAEEDANHGGIPSLTGNLDENNVAIVQTSGYTGVDVDGDGNVGNADENGIAYDLGSNIIRGEEYVVSFKLKWKGLPSVYDRIRVELGYRDINNNEFNPKKVVEFGLDIVPTSTWERYTLGPITGGVDEFGNDILNYLTTHLNIVHIYSGTDTVPSVEFYLDGVSMEPALQVKEDGTLLSRSCRLYPRKDSPSCSYIDENSSIFTGWEGYCLERYPADSKYCLNWWPVDMLKGESDIFSALRPARYAGRSPLYMCVQAKGYYGYGYNTGDQGANTVGYKVQSKIQLDTNRARTKGHVQCTVLNDVAVDGWTNISVCNLWSSLAGSGDGPVPSSLYCERVNLNDSFLTCNVNRYGGRGGDYYTTGENICSFIWKSSGLFGGTNDCDGDYDPRGIRANGTYGDYGDCSGCYRTNGTTRPHLTEVDNEITLAEVEGIYLDQVAVSGTNTDHTGWLERKYDSVTNATYFATEWDTGNTNLPKDIDVIGDGIVTTGYSFWVKFEQIGSGESKITGISFIGIKEGSDTTDASSGQTINIYYYLKEPCTTIAKVAETNENRVWAERITRSDGYSVPDLLYRYAQDFAPFGGIVAPPGNSPTAWPLMFVESREPLKARAGSPYSCSNSDPNVPSGCLGRTCSTGNSNNCANDTETDACYSAGGYCIGLASGYCSGNPTITCSFNTDCVFDNRPCITSGGGAAYLFQGAQGIQHLKALFARSYGMWTWDQSVSAYQQTPAATNLNNVWITDYKDMDVCQYVGAQGRAVRLNYDPPNLNAEYCGVPPVIDDISVGSGGSSSVNLPGGGTVQLTFSIKADPNQLPIRYISVDWGDNTTRYETSGNYGSGTVFLTHEYRVNGSHMPSIKVYDNWQWCGVEMDAGSSCPSGDCRFIADLDDCDSTAADTAAPPMGCSARNGFICTGITITVTP